MPEENLYPSLNGNDGQHRETEPSGEPQELQPLFEGNGVTITTTTIAPLAGQSLTAANHQTAAAPEPRRKVKFLQKLLNFCGDPKRREQTCSRRNRTLTLCLGCSIICLMCSLTLVHMMWFTNSFNEMVIPRLALTKGSQSAEWWATPPYHTYLKVYIFNYTNVEEYKTGQDDKLKLEDIGPYTYIERTEKINVTYFPNGTITYREKRSYTFDPEHSNGYRYDPVIVPNIPLTSGLEMIKNSGFLEGWAIKSAITSFSQPLFLRLPADSFLWGYEDSFVNFAKLTKPMPFDQFGVLVLKNRTSDDIFRISSGDKDFNQIGVIESLNGETEMEFWKTDKCNKVEGTDGSQFPPGDIQKDKTVTVYVKDICRKFDLEFEEDVSVFGDLPAKRYRSPMDSFAYPVNDTEKECYCRSGVCPPNGVYDASVCTNGAPIYVSFPHFYSGDPELAERFEGIKAVKELHATFADLHPRMGFPMQFSSRFQINVRIPEGSPKNLLENVPEGEILPVLWMEVVPATFPAEVQDAIYHSSFTANFVEAVLKYGSIASTSAFLVFMLYLLAAMFYLKR